LLYLLLIIIKSCIIKPSLLANPLLVLLRHAPDLNGLASHNGHIFPELGPLPALIRNDRVGAHVPTEVALVPHLRPWGHLVLKNRVFLKNLVLGRLWLQLVIR
jgi:hypothetical protein